MGLPWSDKLLKPHQLIMNPDIKTPFAVLLLSCSLIIVRGADPSIISLDNEGSISWTSGNAEGLTILEKTGDLMNGPWVPAWYDLATNEIHQTEIPTSGDSLFYRLKVRDNQPDPEMILHLSFDNDLDAGMVIDSSGYGHHARRFGRPNSETNWPSHTLSIDNSLAGDFNYYWDGWSHLGRSGDYAGISNVEKFLNLTNATITAWAHFRESYSGEYDPDNNAAIISTGYAAIGTWELARWSSDMVKFTVEDDSGKAYSMAFPDRTYLTGGDTGGWHWYAVTFENGKVKAFFDGVKFNSKNWPVPYLSVNKSWIGIGCKTHKGDPWLDDADIYPNHGWMNGKIDDVKIYSRILNESEIYDMYHSYDVLRPTKPNNIELRSAGNNLAEIRWEPALDKFGVERYAIRRNGNQIGTTAGHMFLDDQVVPGGSYVYTVEAFDHAGNHSGQSQSLTYNAPSEDVPTEFILDDNDGSPWTEFEGEWYKDCCWISGAWGSGWKHNNAEDKGIKTVTFQPNLPEAAEYEVWIRYVQRGSYANNVPVDVKYKGGEHTSIINQRTSGGVWLSLGTFPFDKGIGGSVTIRTDATTGRVIADAVRFTK